MVENDWLSPEVIGARLARVAPSDAASSTGCATPAHVERLGGPVRDLLRGLARMLTEPEVARFVDSALQRQLRELPLDAAAGRWLGARARERERADAAFETVATSLANLAARPRDRGRAALVARPLGTHAPRGRQALVPFVLRRKVVQRKIVEAACDYAATELRGPPRDAAHPLPAARS